MCRIAPFSIMLRFCILCSFLMTSPFGAETQKTRSEYPLFPEVSFYAESIIPTPLERTPIPQRSSEPYNEFYSENFYFDQSQTSLHQSLPQFHLYNPSLIPSAPPLEEECEFYNFPSFVELEKPIQTPKEIINSFPPAPSTIPFVKSTQEKSKLPSLQPKEGSENDGIVKKAYNTLVDLKERYLGLAQKSQESPISQALHSSNVSYELSEEESHEFYTDLEVVQTPLPPSRPQKSSQLPHKELIQAPPLSQKELSELYKIQKENNELLRALLENGRNNSIHQEETSSLINRVYDEVNGLQERCQKMQNDIANPKLTPIQRATQILRLVYYVGKCCTLSVSTYKTLIALPAFMAPPTWLVAALTLGAGVKALT